jgi:hypothetical protein
MLQPVGAALVLANKRADVDQCNISSAPSKLQRGAAVTRTGCQQHYYGQHLMITTANLQSMSASARAWCRVYSAAGGTLPNSTAEHSCRRWRESLWPAAHDARDSTTLPCIGPRLLSRLARDP